MRLKNNFSDKTRGLYSHQHCCQSCGSNRILSLHHIGGRKSASKLNAILLCHNCHARCGHSEEEEKTFFEIALKYHLREGNTLEKEDITFIQTNERLNDVFIKLQEEVL